MWTSENRPKYNRDKLRYPSDLTSTSLDLIQRSMSDYVIHSTVGTIGEADSMLSRCTAPALPARAIARCLRRASFGHPLARVLDNIDPLAKLAAKR